MQNAFLPAIRHLGLLLDLSGLITEKMRVRGLIRYSITIVIVVADFTSIISEISIELLSFHRAMSARTDNRAIDISQIFDVRYEAAHAPIFSVISPDKSRSLWPNVKI